MDIYQKLLEVRKAVPYLKKDAEGFNFKFVSSSKTLGALRDKMDEMGLLLVPSVTAFEVRDHETEKKKHEYFTILTMVFKWVNAEEPKEFIECQWTGQGLDSGEKGVGKALTYGEKYFLLKFFNIATDKDDPDAFQNGKQEKKSKKEEKPKDDKKTKDDGKYALLQEIGALKKQIDQDEYYDLLKTVDVKKSNQLKPAVMPMVVDHLKKIVGRNERFAVKMKEFWEKDLDMVIEVLKGHGYDTGMTVDGDFKEIKVKVDQLTIFEALNQGVKKDDVSG